MEIKDRNKKKGEAEAPQDEAIDRKMQAEHRACESERG